MKQILSNCKTHEEHGFEHGKEQKKIIATYLKKWEENTLLPRNLSLQKYTQFIKEQMFFIDAIREHCPELLLEIKGIAKGANIDFDIIFCWQLLDEHYWILNKYFNNIKLDDAETNGCSTLARKKTEIIFAQNLDIPLYKDGCQTILRQSFTDQSALNQTIFTQAGALTSFGVNEKGISVGVNALPQLSFNEKGLPVTFILRCLLNAKTLEEANQKVQNIPHATGHHYLICDNKKFTSWECSKNKILCLNNEDNQTEAISHTNHPLTTDDILLALPPNPANTSVQRLQLINDSLSRKNGLELDQIQDIMCQEPVCVTGKNSGFTFFSAVFDYSNQAFPSIYYQARPPIQGAYQKL